MTHREGIALVTGASRGIGAACARALSEEGWPVALVFREDAEGVSAVQREIVTAGGRAVTVRADVADPAQVEEAFDRAEDEFASRALVLVNNAGIRADGLTPALSNEDWQSVIDVNLTASFYTTRRALRSMMRARFGRIVNVASVIGLRANPGQGNYAAAKAGLISFTRTVAVEVARRGITVNAVAPGYIETALIADIPTADRLPVPVRRAGTPDDVAACVRFLASEQAAYVTGSTLVVDGGLSA